MKNQPPQSSKKGSRQSTSQKPWSQMNRKQRREMQRKIQSQDLNLEVVHPNAAGIDIGNEVHYVAVPPNRSSEAVRRFGCTTAELLAMGRLAQTMRDPDGGRAIHRSLLDRGIRYLGRNRVGS